MNPRVRAGGYPPCSESGCNSPEGECVSNGACMSHSMFSRKAEDYVPPSVADDDYPVHFAGSEPWPTPIRWLAIVCLVVIVLAFLLPLPLFQ